MNRSFGIELEIAGINRQTALTVLRVIGIAVQDESYNHTTRAHWKLVEDSSVRGGFEIVSPVLHGEQGIEEAMAVAEALSDTGATVNRSCGFHVHCPTQGGVKPPPLGGGFSVSFVGCGHEQLS